MAGVVVRYRGRTVALDAGSARTSEEVAAALRAAFRLRREARFALVRDRDGAVLVPSPPLPPGEYVLELADDGLGEVKQRAAMALVVAPLLVLYYRLLLPALLRGFGDD